MSTDIKVRLLTTRQLAELTGLPVWTVRTPAPLQCDVRLSKHIAICRVDMRGGRTGPAIDVPSNIWAAQRSRDSCRALSRQESRVERNPHVDGANSHLDFQPGARPNLTPIDRGECVSRVRLARTRDHGTLEKRHTPWRGARLTHSPFELR